MKSINPGFPPASSTWTPDFIPQAWQKSHPVQPGPGCCRKRGAEHHSRDAGLGRAGWTRAEPSSAPLRQDPAPHPAPLALRLAPFALVSCGHKVHKSERWVCVDVCDSWGRWGGGGGGRGDPVLLWGELWVLQCRHRAQICEQSSPASPAASMDFYC